MLQRMRESFSSVAFARFLQRKLRRRTCEEDESPADFSANHAVAGPDAGHHDRDMVLGLLLLEGNRQKHASGSPEQSGADFGSR
jgi:hypothetical protein